MKANYLLGLLSLCCLLILSVTDVQATHVRAGEITTRRISNNNTYEITITLYYDENRGKTAADQQNDIDICFGVGNEVGRAPRVARRFINPNTTINIYRINYTYPGPGTYNIITTITNRNEGTRNIPNSINTSFELRTTILVNASLGLNSTPVMLNPPLDSARVGQKFCHNPAAYDADGDSLSYRLWTPAGRIGPDNFCRPQLVLGYSRPELIGGNPRTEAGTAPATLTVDPLTGDVCWDAPAERGQYNIAFIVEEYRNGIKIGEIVRDMQIIVVDGTNKRPELRVPQDLCVEAGTLINQPITATDPDGNRIELTYYGGPFNRGPDGQPLALVAPAAATLTPPGGIVNAPLTANFRWQTNCAHIRDEPYDVILRVVDYPRNQTQLATLASFQIRIYAPGPQNLTAQAGTSPGGRSIVLNWGAYNCALPGAQMRVYRREGCEALPLDPCTNGGEALVAGGYTLVGQVPITQTSFTDNQNLRRGAQYSYRLVAVFERPRGGASVASAQACVSLPLQTPLMTHVTVDTTSTTGGRITVRWTRPIGVNPQDLGGPFQYRLYRATGLAGTDFSLIQTRPTSLAVGAGDTVFVDRGLNTEANAYRYRVEFLFTEASTGQLTVLDVSEAASSVRLSAVGQSGAIALAWQASTPWSNDNQTHRIFRSQRGPNGPFNEIARVAVTGGGSYRFTDTGADQVLADGNVSVRLSVDSSYCYRVLTVGRYVSPAVNLPLLENYSQGICASPIDTTRPCAPVLRLDSLACGSLSAESGCNQSEFINNLSWQVGSGSGCDLRIARYEVYYSRYREDSTASLLGSVAAPEQVYAHRKGDGYGGCYSVRAVTRSGVASAASNRVCQEGCPWFALPNVFTPNGDGKNDVFQALACPRQVEEVVFVVYNRYGSKVYESRGGEVSWDGRSSGGQALSSGLYYYEANVLFSGSSRVGSRESVKGWVQLIREGTTMR
ncbi:T9SS type B sorting domain-containing protein [Tellurirhabdus bombi]|uniref:T9SS type B sorting domain-containing protein n=1 Tax=Tellurirhabdus bombi TaxID=2907205 RepID=UPI001F256182|nr:gliding motility-associated C-terminal domain-containing protein [Tellurirhabdus bombi]